MKIKKSNCEADKRLLYILYYIEYSVSEIDHQCARLKGNVSQ